MIALALRYWWAIVIAALLAACGALYVRGNHYQSELAEYRAEVAEGARLAAEAARAEEQRRQAAAEEEAKHARDEKKVLEDDVVRLAGVADGVRDELAAFKRRAAARACPAIGGKSQPSPDPLDLLAELYGRADKEAGELARYADALRIAGGACERIGDKVSGR